MEKALTVAGVMSGTSADGIDVAICRISPARDKNGTPRIRLIGHSSSAYPRQVRAAVLAAMDAKSISVAELSRLNWRLGELYADAIEHAEREHKAKVQLVGCHGQTIYHQGTPANYLGSKLRTTWQTGEPAVIAERFHVPVVSDFRPADVAAGGQGAPLVPMLDFCMFRSAKTSRVLQNLGGIGNLTAIPAAAGAEDLMAFDTGPSNMVIDGCMQALYGRKFDRNGAVARRGRIMEDVIAEILSQAYFSAPPPKSCGREEYGDAFVKAFLRRCRKTKSARDEDIVATATALTASSIIDAYRRFVWAHLGRHAPLAKIEYIVAGGGAKNLTLMNLLSKGLSPLGIRIRSVDEFGIPAQAKEGVAFALLAWLTWHNRPGNIPAATGAQRGVVLGRISHG